MPRRIFLVSLIFFLGTLAAGDVSPKDESAWKLGVLAQSDCRAELRPCHCAGNPSGGLALRSGLFQRTRAQPNPVVVVDGGDFVPSPEETLAEEKAAFMIDAMARLKYDAVALGDLELLRGTSFLREAASALPLVCANLQAPGLEIPPLRWVEKDGKRIAITAYVDPILYYDHAVAFESPPESLLIVDPAEVLPALLGKIREEADAVVVLAHADGASIQALFTDGVLADVLVVGHEPALGKDAPLLGGARLVEPGPRSRQVAFLTLLFSPDVAPQVDAYRILDLKQGGRADPTLDAMLHEFEARMGLSPD